MSALNNAPRLFESDLTPLQATLAFNGKDYVMRFQITAFGDVATQTTDFVCLLTGHDTSDAASDHYRKLMAQCPALHHNNKLLKNHIQVGMGSGWGRDGVRLQLILIF